MSDHGIIQVPGRVNLIGEHIDYHNLAVLPMALPQRVTVSYTARNDAQVCATSPEYGERSFSLAEEIAPSPSGDWANYVKAAARAALWKWPLTRGANLDITSTLPPAAGLSSSSAVLTAATLALLEANRLRPSFEELMEVLPEGEHFVGTRGGGMDHAAVLGGRRGAAVLVEFAPARATTVEMPEGWQFLVAHSRRHAEKSGAVRDQYNERRFSGTRGLAQLGFASFKEALEGRSLDDLHALAARLDGSEQRCFRHVVTEAFRVHAAVDAMRAADSALFGRLLAASHLSLRDDLRISCPELDRLVDCAMEGGALGARLTGAGFGGCAVILCPPGRRDQLRAHLEAHFYNEAAPRDIIDAEPSAGALQLRG